MAGLIVLGKSVGRNGSNLAIDVAKVGAALTAVGPDRGGVFGPPLSVEGLAQAIEMFQRFQRLPSQDGRVDPGGGTLRRINEILNPGQRPPGPAPRPTPGGTGTIRRIPPPDGRPNRVSSAAFTPDEPSFLRDVVFEWRAVTGGGAIQFFELDENVVPNWFGVVVPDGVASAGDVHLFFHPTPSQAGYKDSNYPTKVGWSPLFHYTTDLMSAQFCAAATGQVLIMPLMTQGSSGDCGVLPARWEAIFGQILGLIAAGPNAQTAPVAPVSSVVVSSFSSGVAYSAAFRARAGLGPRLQGTIDFDGVISTNRKHSTTLPPSALKIWQTPASSASLSAQARQNIFPVGKERWGGPFAGHFSKGHELLEIHGTVPQTMMFFAASRTRPR
jgi:hypothetical protein